MKKLVIVLICTLMILSAVGNSSIRADSNKVTTRIEFWSNSNQFSVNGAKSKMDSECIIRNSRTFIVARYMVEALDGEIGWDSDTRTVSINCRNHKINLTIDNPKAEVDGESFAIDLDNSDVTPLIYKDRTLIPLRFAVESLGGKIEWNATEKKAESVFSKTQLENVCFLHHSCGSNWIREGKIREGLTDKGFDFYDHGYNGQGLTLPSGKKAGYSYKVPDDNTNPDGFATIFAQENHTPPDNTLSYLLQHDVIIFKSCYPVSDIKMYATLEEYKDYYRIVAHNTDKYPDKLFVIVTQPPLVKKGSCCKLTAANARSFVNWLKSDEFLSGHPNLVTFDWFDLLAEDNKNMGNFNNLRTEYSKGDGDSHPNKKANEETAPAFIDFISEVAVSYD